MDINMELPEDVEKDLNIWIHKKENRSMELAEKLITGLYKAYMLIKTDLIVEQCTQKQTI
jgi:hypothetical protein